MDAEGTRVSVGGKRRALLLTSALVSALSLSCRAKPTPPAHRPSLEIVLIDDSLDPFAGSAASLPPGVAILEESSIAKWPDTIKHRYARLVLQSSETLRQARVRIEPWIRALALPPDKRLVWQPLIRWEGSKPEVEGYRTYLVRGAAIAGTGALESARAIETADGKAAVGLVFSKVPAELLREVTRHHVGERMAIVVDDVARTAPRIETEIANGTLAITMGSDNNEGTRAEARELARALMGGAP